MNLFQILHVNSLSYGVRREVQAWIVRERASPPTQENIYLWWEWKNAFQGKPVAEVGLREGLINRRK